jgi:hypothetical protein
VATANTRPLAGTWRVARDPRRAWLGRAGVLEMVSYR